MKNLAELIQGTSAEMILPSPDRGTDKPVFKVMPGTGVPGVLSMPAEADDSSNDSSDVEADVVHDTIAEGTTCSDAMILESCMWLAA